MPAFGEIVFNGRGEVISRTILEEDYISQSEFEEQLCVALFGKSFEDVAQDIILAHKRAVANKDKL